MAFLLRAQHLDNLKVKIFSPSDGGQGMARRELTVEELPGYLTAPRAWTEMVGEFRRDGQ